MLSLARVPQTRIGSFQFHDDGTITLTNRPLSCSMMILENEGATRTIPRGETYSCTHAFVSDTRTSIRAVLCPFSVSQGQYTLNRRVMTDIVS